MCPLVPLIDKIARRIRLPQIGDNDRGQTENRSPSAGTVPWRRQPALVAAPADTLALTANKQISYIERGLTDTRKPQ